MHIDFRKHMSYVDELYKKGVLNKKEASDLEHERYNVCGGLCLSMLIKKDLEKKAEKYFKIINEEHGKDIFTRRVPIYIMKLR